MFDQYFEYYAIIVGGGRFFVYTLHMPAVQSDNKLVQPTRDTVLAEFAD